MAVTLDPSISMNSASSVYTDASIAAVDKLSSQIETAQSDDEMLQACKDFESYMLESIYKNMEKTTKIFSDDDDEGDSTAKMYMENFKDTYYQDLMSKMMASGQGIGLAEQLYQSITNQSLGISSDTTTADSTTDAQSAVATAIAQAVSDSEPATAAQTAAEITGAAAVSAASAIASSTM